MNNNLQNRFFWFNGYIWHVLVLCDNSPKMKQDNSVLKTPSKSSEKLVFFLILLHIPIDLCVEASENLSFRFQV